MGVPGGCAAWNAVLTSSSPWPRRLAPEPGAGPVTARRSIKLRLLDRRTAPVSTAFMTGHTGAGWQFTR
ncbi:uncharacterized protein TOL2_C25840 [Desulfobacula toluolica Tol2]|uniref:Uncharacterized protein n=1 Tax=Desulfobacula toluolica (strain DSM 7467 / Tol2) TaxID=651182 RepID=K0NL83_DESTT|nr:uncharacterized protein TOL2_C25840 [Desulfobacula toluolica Tol2]